LKPKWNGVEFKAKFLSYNTTFDLTRYKEHVES